MRTILLILSTNIVAIAFIALAGFMMINHIKGAGWVVLCAMCTTMVSNASNTNEE